MRFPLPIIKLGKTLPNYNGKNNAFRVILDPEAPQFLAVAAQEIYESRFKLFRIGGAFLFPIAVLFVVVLVLGFHPAFFSGSFAVPLFAIFWYQVGPGIQTIELMGHEVEVQAAVHIYNANEETKRHQEARTMAATKEYRFYGWTIDEIVNSMKKRRKGARNWVMSHLVDLNYVEDKFGVR